LEPCYRRASDKAVGCCFEVPKIFWQFFFEVCRIYFLQFIQYTYKVGKFCIFVFTIYSSGLQFHPWIGLLPQEKSPTAGLELTTFRSVCHMQICGSFCVASAQINILTLFQTWSASSLAGHLFHAILRRKKGCQIVWFSFQTKIPNLGKFWRAF
jgi:hypothetical protein